MRVSAGRRRDEAGVARRSAPGDGFAALLLGVARDPKLGLIAVGGFAAAVLVFALCSWGALVLLRRSVPEARAPRWLVLATRQLAARPAFAVLQVSALSVGLLALILLAILRTDLISSWRQATPKDAPNRFVINVQPPQADAFQAKLRLGHRRMMVSMIPAVVAVTERASARPTLPTRSEASRPRVSSGHSASLPRKTSRGGRWTADEQGG